eukprot:COSAG03_NODE_180_length_11014_cov_43.655428_5_plen_123_part_00
MLWCEGANIGKVGETDIEETKLPTPVLHIIIGASVVPLSLRACRDSSLTPGIRPYSRSALPPMSMASEFAPQPSWSRAHVTQLRCSFAWRFSHSASCRNVVVFFAFATPHPRQQVENGVRPR